MSKKTWPTYLREMAEALELSEKSKMVAANELRELRADCAAFCSQNERLIKAAGAENLDGAIAAIEAQRAALERARALLAELEWCGVDAWLACPWCLGYQDAHPGERHGHAADCKLAALLALASGGAE